MKTEQMGEEVENLREKLRPGTGVQELQPQSWEPAVRLWVESRGQRELRAGMTDSVSYLAVPFLLGDRNSGFSWAYCCTE